MVPLISISRCLLFLMAKIVDISHIPSTMILLFLLAFMIRKFICILRNSILINPLWMDLINHLLQRLLSLKCNKIYLCLWMLMKILEKCLERVVFWSMHSIVILKIHKYSINYSSLIQLILCQLKDGPWTNKSISVMHISSTPTCQIPTELLSPRFLMDFSLLISDGQEARDQSKSLKLNSTTWRKNS